MFYRAGKSTKRAADLIRNFTEREIPCARRERPCKAPAAEVLCSGAATRGNAC